MASVAARTRGILRRCAPQDDNNFVILSGTKWSEESRACAFTRRSEYARMARRGRGTRGNGAPSRGPGQLLLALRPNSPPRALRDGNVPPGGQSEAGGTGAQCAPLRGGSRAPPCCNGRWVAAVLRDNAFTRAARPEGERVIRKRGETAGVSPLREPQRACMRATAAQRRLLASRSAQCGRAGRVPARWERVRPPPCRANTQGWRAEVVAQASFSWPFGPIHLLAPYGRCGRAGRVPARDARAVPSALQGASFFTPSAAFLQ